MKKIFDAVLFLVLSLLILYLSKGIVLRMMLGTVYGVYMVSDSLHHWTLGSAEFYLGMFYTGMIFFLGLHSHRRDTK